MSLPNSSDPNNLLDLEKAFESIQPLAVSDFSDTINVSSMSDCNYNYSSAGPVITNNSIIPVSGTFTWQSSPNTIWSNDSSDNYNSGKLMVNGKNADIEINGVSLMSTLRALEEKLNILRPNHELESEWDELRELGNQYRKLEAEFAEKTKMWDTLKSMPPPKID